MQIKCKILIVFLISIFAFIHVFTDKKYYFFWCANLNLDRMLIANKGYLVVLFSFMPFATLVELTYPHIKKYLTLVSLVSTYSNRKFLFSDKKRLFLI
jgi:hypothetical protein